MTSAAKAAERPRASRTRTSSDKPRRVTPAGAGLTRGDKGETIRRHIVETANRLFYERGYNQTSFSDIADAAGIPRGNFYYYFKTKDDILVAVVEHRLANLRAMLTDWDASTENPAERLQKFLGMLRTNAKDLSRYGCPIGSLNIELGKAQPKLKAKAREMFDLLRNWLKGQLKSLGARDANGMALHLLGRAQGIAVMTHVYGDARLVNSEVDRLEELLAREYSQRDS